MSTDDFLDICYALVSDYTGANLDEIDTTWFCQTPQGKRATFITDSDEMHFECVFSEKKNEIYFDAYAKEYSSEIPCCGINENKLS